jgi:flagellar motor switch/type III secretory pathway protein FliN
MSDLRIRSEAFEEVWAQPFLPPQAHFAGAGDDGDDGDFGPLIIAASRSLTALFGLTVEVLPGRPPKPEGGEPPPRVAPVLAALLATVQLGGDPARADVAGTTARRQAQAIADALDAVVARVWPLASSSPSFDLDISCAGHSGHARVMAPPRAPAAAPQPVAALALGVLDLPMRLRIELASEMAPVSSLLPLRAGTVLPISPSREMPLILGDHCVGHATVTPTADGRQQATITDVGVFALSGGFR